MNKNILEITREDKIAKIVKFISQSKEIVANVYQNDKGRTQVEHTEKREILIDKLAELLLDIMENKKLD